jgi:DNA-binding NarL/FixJ family response regulator
MHEGSVIFSENQLLPVLNLKVFFEIADIKTDETIVLTIFRYTESEGYRKVFTREYGKYCNSVLTHREMEIIRLCHEGLSSKMIAEKMNLSIHTVKNHKRHCMEKTSTHNINELIHFCLQKHWL